MTRHCRRESRASRRVWVACVACLWLLVSTSADARVVRIEIEQIESPTFDGTSFGAVGDYEKLRGRVFGEVDPADPASAVIADIDLAPRNARGRIEYAADVVILRPRDPAKGNGRLFFEVNNRGNLLSLGQMNDAPSGGSDPSTAADAGHGFLMRQGYTFASSGWDVTAGESRQRLTITVPVATQPDGSPVVGPALEELVVDNDRTMTGRLTYPASTHDTTRAVLTVRTRYADSPVPIDPSGWTYVDDRTIRLQPEGTAFEQGRLYELTYPARDPLVAGLAFAALQDVVVFLREAAVDDMGTPNPLAEQIQHVYSYAFSQPARFMRDFVHLGFNRSPTGGRVFDGVLNWVGGASGGFFNFRFAQPARTHRHRIGRRYPERQFPFANQVLHDPVTGRTDGRLRRCLETDTCPKILEANSSNEYWVKGASLLHTDPRGEDLEDPPNVRVYLFSSLPHVAGFGPPGPGICQQPRSQITPNAALRALFVALDEWVSAGVAPPPSQVPRRSDGTLVPALALDESGFPTIPGVLYPGLHSTGDLFDYGPDFDRGVLTVLPPVHRGAPYPVLVPMTDADGNDIAGVRLPPVAVPLATYTGWGVRAPTYGGDDLCDAFGQEIPFARTRADRVAAGDPRLSIEERYPDRRSYLQAIRAAADDLRRRRLLLDEDVARVVEEAEGRTADW